MVSVLAERSAIGDVPPGWQIKPIRALASKVGSGATPFGGESVYMEQRVSHALIRSQHVFDRYFNAAELAFISKEHSDELRNAEVRSGDVLLNITGDGVTFARACLVPDDILPACVNQHVSIIRVNPEVCDPGYLLSFLTHPRTKRYMESFNTGGSRRAITKGHIESFEVPLPPLPVQRRIAGILSAYDELIENSQRRIRILETMARTLYREWFVRENLPVQEVSLSFQKRTFSALCELVKEPFSEQLHANRSLLDLSRIPQRSIAPTEIGKASELTTSRILFEPGDTLFGAIRCYLHKVVVAHYPGVTNTSVLVLRPRQPVFRSLVALIASDVETIRWADTHSTGTKMPVINWAVFQTMPAPLPSTALVERFEAIAGPMMEQIGVLATQIQNLRRTRDLLLPRLLSGQINLTTN